MRRLLAIAGAALLAATSAGCDVGPTSSAPTFARVNEEVLKPSCTLACHSGGANAAGGLDLSNDPYGVLVHGAPDPGSQCGGVAMKRVAPGNPGASLVYVKIEAKIHNTTPPCGDVMPLGDNTLALSPADAELVRAWIAAGAKND